MRHVLVLAVVAVLAAGCGARDEDEAVPQAPAASPGAETGAETGASDPPVEPPPATASPPVDTERLPGAPLLVYFLRDGKIAAGSRSGADDDGVARAALTALAAGPAPEESEVGFETEVPADLQIERLTVEGGAATLELAGECPPMAQIVYTLTQFPTVDEVRGNCAEDGLTRADFEDVTPAILVESPTIGERVTSPLRIRGTANTFEANFQVNIVDWDGRIVVEDFVTATSGSGERGTFDATFAFDVDRPGGALIVFERSAEDNSLMNVVEIPLELQP